MGGLFAVQGVLFMVLSIAAFAMEVWALVQAARFRADAYVAAGKQTKRLWVGVLSVAAVIGFLALPGGFLSVLGFLSILAVAASGGFLAGVRPALRAVQGRGGSTSSGPYGGW